MNMNWLLIILAVVVLVFIWLVVKMLLLFGKAGADFSQISRYVETHPLKKKVRKR